MINSQIVQKKTKKSENTKMSNSSCYWEQKQQRCEIKSSSYFSIIIRFFFCVVLFSYFLFFFSIFFVNIKKPFVISVKKISWLFIVMSLIRAMIIFFFGCHFDVLSQRRRKNPTAAILRRKMINKILTEWMLWMVNRHRATVKYREALKIGKINIQLELLTFKVHSHFCFNGNISPPIIVYKWEIK